MKLDLHTHTYYSHQRRLHYDGIDSPENIVKRAKKIGLDVIAITDHDTIEGALKVRKTPEIEVIIGEEVTTNAGHLLAINIQENIRPGLSVEETVDKIKEQDGISVAPHPFDNIRASIKNNAIYCDMIEGYNAGNMDRLSDIKARRFARNHEKPIIAGSDAHSVKMLGHCRTLVNADNFDEAVKKIMKGDAKFKAKYYKIGEVREYALERIRMSHTYTMKYINQTYPWPVRPVGKKLMTAIAEGKINKPFQVFSYVALPSYLVYTWAKSIVGKDSKKPNS